MISEQAANTTSSLHKQEDLLSTKNVSENNTIVSATNNYDHIQQHHHQHHHHYHQHQHQFQQTQQAQLAFEQTKFYLSSSISEENEGGETESIDDEKDDVYDDNTVLEESPNGRWNKLATEISVQQLPDFDTINLAIDTERGLELAWNEISLFEIKQKINDFKQQINNNNNNNTGANYIINNLSDEKLIEKVNFNLNSILHYLIKIDHLNILTFYDYWYVDNGEQSKWVVITELSTAGSLKKLLDNTRQTKTQIKPKTYKRWLNQLLSAINYIHLQHVSIFRGNLTTETIFIQNNSAIKIAPALLPLAFSEFQMWTNINTDDDCNSTDTNLSNNNNTIPRSPTKINTVNDLLKLNDNIIIKDLNSLGCIAIEIFTTHLNLSSIINNYNINNANNSNISPTHSISSGSGSSITNNINIIARLMCDRSLLNIIPIGDNIQKEFIYYCFNSDELIPLNVVTNNDLNIKQQKKLKTSYLSYQPLVNEIYSLKVLSVYSLLMYFQDKHLKSSSQSNSCLPTRNNSVLISDNTDPLEISTSPSQTISNSVSSINTQTSNSNNNYNNKYSKSQQKSGRKASINFLTNTSNLPKDFFAILEDIKLGCYPRLNNLNELNLFSTSFSILKNIPSNNCFSLLINGSGAQRKSSFTNICTANSNFNDATNTNNDQDQLRSNVGNKNLRRNSFHRQNSIEENELRDNMNSLNVNNEHSIHQTDIETRRIVSENCSLIKSLTNTNMYHLSIKLKFDDNFNRLVECNLPNSLFINKVEKQQSTILYNDHNSHNVELNNNNNNNNEDQLKNLSDLCITLSNELVEYGLINDKDKNTILQLLKKTFKSCY